MKFIKKTIKKIIILILLIVVCVTLVLVVKGYYMYKQAIDNISIEEKVNNIMSNKNYVTLDEISNHYINAVLAIEDHRFYNHNGIDYISTLRAMYRNITTKQLAEGGSTITQQLAKNMYFTQEKKFERKIAEIFVVNELEKIYSKDDILTMYMNIVYFGNGYYGINNASKGYLYKKPIEMTLHEASFIAGIPNAPSIYSSDRNINLAKQRQKQVLESMVKHEFITIDEFNEVSNNESN